MADCQRPFTIKIELIAGIVAIPLPDTRGPAADLREFQPLRPKEPFHMSRCGADPKRLAYLPAHLFDLSIGRRVHPVGGDDLRRYPAGAHRIEHVWEVMADEVVRHAAFDG